VQLFRVKYIIFLGQVNIVENRNVIEIYLIVAGKVHILLELS